MLAKPSGDSLYALCLCFEKSIDILAIGYATLIQILYEYKYASSNRCNFYWYDMQVESPKPRLRFGDIFRNSPILDRNCSSNDFNSFGAPVRYSSISSIIENRLSFEMIWYSKAYLVQFAEKVCPRKFWNLLCWDFANITQFWGVDVEVRINQTYFSSTVISILLFLNSLETFW